MNITVVGLGLIGASLAKAIKRRTNNRIIGIDINSEVTNKALEDGTIDRIGTADDLAQTDLTIVSLYPNAAADFVKSNADSFKKGSVVIDTCGIKSKICAELVGFSHEHGFEFIGAHPMAGKEKFGYDYSEATLFDNAYMIFTPVNADENNVDMLKELSQKIGFKGVTVSTPAEHDRIIAYTSQMPHVLACAYVSDPDAMLHNGFSAGSYKDISRVADINAKLWQELFIENSSQLVGHIDVLIDNLQKIKQLIENGDHKALQDALQKARDTKAKIG